MKQLVAVFLAAFGGILAGSWAVEAQAPQSAPAERLEVRELVIVDQSGKPLAILGSKAGRTSLSFLDQNSSLSVEIGADPGKNRQFVRFHSAQNSIVAALETGPPNREASLVLGDNLWNGRMIFGALRDDDEGAPIKDWGMTFTGPYSNRRWFGVRQHEEGPQRAAGIYLLKNDKGETWSIP